MLCELVHSRRCRWTWCSVDWCNPECEELKRLVTGSISQCSFSFNKYRRSSLSVMKCFISFVLDIITLMFILIYCEKRPISCVIGTIEIGRFNNLIGVFKGHFINMMN